MPGPELKWEKMEAAPVPRLDGAAIQIKNLLFVFAGYGTIDFGENLDQTRDTCVQDLPSLLDASVYGLSLVISYLNIHVL